MGDRLRLGDDDRGEAPGGHDSGDRADLGHDPADQTVHLTGEPVDRAGLQRLHRVLPHHRPRPDQLDLAQLGGARGQRVDGDLDAGGQRPAQELALGRDDVQVGRGAEVDHDRGPAEKGVRGQGVDDAVRTDLPRVVGQHRDSGPHPWLDDHRGQVRVVAVQHGAQLVQHRGDGGAQRDPGDLGLVREQGPVQQPQLVGRGPAVGLDPPGPLEGVPGEQPDHGVGVAHVDREQHQLSSRRSSPMSSTGAECVSAPTAR